MKDIKKIEETAKRHAYENMDNLNDSLYESSFISGALSDEAKEYHTDGMYTKLDIDEIVKYTISQWISPSERNESDHKKLVNRFLQCDLTEWLDEYNETKTK